MLNTALHLYSLLIFFSKGLIAYLNTSVVMLKIENASFFIARYAQEKLKMAKKSEQHSAVSLLDQ